MTPLALAATSIGVFLGLSNIPQAYKIFKRKSADDLALVSFIIVEVGSFIWVLYGIEQKSIPIIVPNLLGVFATGLVLIGTFIYRKPKKKTN